MRYPGQEELYLIICALSLLFMFSIVALRSSLQIFFFFLVKHLYNCLHGRLASIDKVFIRNFHEVDTVRMVSSCIQPSGAHLINDSNGPSTPLYVTDLMKAHRSIGTPL